jgi:hypothetical protein
MNTRPAADHPVVEIVDGDEEDVGLRAGRGPSGTCKVDDTRERDQDENGAEQGSLRSG